MEVLKTARRKGRKSKTQDIIDKEKLLKDKIQEIQMTYNLYKKFLALSVEYNYYDDNGDFIVQGGDDFYNSVLQDLSKYKNRVNSLEREIAFLKIELGR